MIERLQRIATLLVRLRILIFSLGGLSIVFILLSLIETPWLNDDKLLVPAILGFCWAVTLYSISKLFVSVPAIPDASAGFRARLSARIRRGMLWLLGIFTLALSFAVLILSYQLLRIW
ncbi:MAG: hypothetical protein COA96_14460 [SAR86 cluster bacterium]|uniref:Uncharacterized protein n=1 Tax=SAR86 cluster bacterium TaxID=2030880 RepID=A0A2A5ATG7_9GAMM|nr:MAG: hypothetical protein COA96_14460 [SAR86 cluster bacterium]